MIENTQKRRVNIFLSKKVLRRLKLYSVKENKPMNQILEELIDDNIPELAIEEKQS